MNVPKHDKRLDELFFAAKDLAPEAQKEFLDTACEDDSIRAEAMQLLESYRDAPKADFHNPVLPQDAVVRSYEKIDSDTTETLGGVVQDGQMIGPYKILQLLGEGGMGSVYMAEQTAPVERRVALKLIRPGMDSKEVLARFEAERQALSMMDHPNIAKVLDAGSDTMGRPYFVMELVKGIPITEYCAKRQISTKRRLALFVAICNAVAHAHQKGIIHRDIKPSNILVAEYDDDVVPKVIDFGVAKATTHKLTQKTLFTRFGQLVGTVEYMSPEQAKLNQLDVDTRSDVYSLGVLLYELLSGATPFDRRRLRSAAYDEMLRIICEEDPPKPSTRLTNEDTASAVAAQQSARVSDLVRVLSGELDWIVMRALEKDRKRRYQSASEFAKDIQRHLDGEAVEACPPTLRYRAVKFLRRNKAQTALIGFLLVLASSLIAWALFLSAWALLSQKETALKREEVAREKAVAAEKAAETAKHKTELIASAARLAAIAESQRATSPIRSALLALEAVESTWQHDRSVLTTAQQALMSATSLIGGEPFEGQRPHGGQSLSTAGNRWLAAAGAGEFRIWDLASDNWSRACYSQTDEATHALISPDQNWIVTAKWKNGIRLWTLDTSSGTPEVSPVATLVGETTHPISRITISEDSRRIVASFRDGHIWVWDLSRESDPTLKPRKFSVLPSENEPESRYEARVPIDISIDGRWLVSCAHDVAYLWDLDADDPLTSVTEFQHDNLVKDVAISHDTRWIVTRQGDAPALLIDRHNANRVTTLPGIAYGVTFTPNGRFLLSVGKGSSHVYDLSAASPVRSRIELVGGLGAVWFSPNSQWMVDAQGATLRLWSLKEILSDTRFRNGAADVRIDLNRPRAVLRGHDRILAQVVFTTDSKYLISSDTDGNMRRWDLESDHPSASLTLDAPGVQVVDVSPDGKWLVVGCHKNGESRLWKLDQTGRPASAIELDQAAEGVGTVTFSPDSRSMATISAVPLYKSAAHKPKAEPIARVWSLEEDGPGEQRLELPHDAAVRSISISADNKFVATSSNDQTARIWNLATGKLEHELPHDEQVFSVAIDSEGKKVATSSGVGKVTLWDLAAGQLEPRVLSGPKLYVMELHFSPDDRWLVSFGGDDDYAYLWDLQSAAPYSGRALPENQKLGMTVGVGFSHDSRWLATTSWYFGPKLWDLHSGDPIASPRQLHFGGAHAAAIGLRRNRLIIGNQKGSHLFDFETNSKPRLVVIPANGVTTVALIPNTEIAVTAGWTKVQLWDVDPNIESLITTARKMIGRELTPEERAQFVVAP